MGFARTSDASTGTGREALRNVFLKSIFENSFRISDDFRLSKICNIDIFFWSILSTLLVSKYRYRFYDVLSKLILKLEYTCA